ncbi:MAG: cupin domain-containing protein [Bacteroidota bacterium]
MGQIEIVFHFESIDTNGQLVMFEFSVPPNAKVPMPHYHEHFDEIAYGVEGIMTFTIDGKNIEIAAGDSCFIPKGIAHGFINKHTTTAKVLSVITPALIGPEYFRELADIINAGGAPDIEKVKLVLNKYGLIPVIND